MSRASENLAEAQSTLRSRRMRARAQQAALLVLGSTALLLALSHLDSDTVSERIDKDRPRPARSSRSEGNNQSQSAPQPLGIAPRDVDPANEVRREAETVLPDVFDGSVFEDRFGEALDRADPDRVFRARLYCEKIPCIAEISGPRVVDREMAYSLEKNLLEYEGYDNAAVSILPFAVVGAEDLDQHLAYLVVFPGSRHDYPRLYEQVDGRADGTRLRALNDISKGEFWADAEAPRLTTRY